MSDFDDLFKEKLSEEEAFPHRNKNWQQLNKQLDAFGVGSTQPPVPTAAAASATSGMLYVFSAILILAVATLCWKNNTQRNDLQQLTQKISALEQQVAQLSSPLSNATPGHQAPLLAPAPPSAQAQALLSEKPIKHPTEAKKSDWHAPNQTLAETAVQPSRGNNATLPIFERPAAILPAHQGPNQAPPAAESGNLTHEKTIKMEQADIVSVPAHPLDTAHPDVPSTGFVAADSLTIGGSSTSPIAPSDTTQAPSKILQVVENQIDTSKNIVPQTPPTPRKDSIQNTTPPPVIKPLRPRLRAFAGIEAVAGKAVPHEAGISLITGQGITAGIALWRSNFWLTGSGMWTRFEENTDKFLPRFHSGGPSHGGGGPHPHDDYKVLKVESSQRQQRYQLGLQYQLPRLLALRPALHVGHVWANTSSTFVSYLIQKIDNPGGPGGPMDPPDEPKYDVRKAPSKSFNNIWSVGAGLDYERNAWAFGLKTEYQDNFGAAGHTFNTFWVTAGLKYRLR